MKRLTINFLLTAAAAVCALDGAAGSRENVLDGAWYGTNYTTPFAHAYRELGRRGIDRKEAIERDVYHMSRLGLNAFRLHLWDVELSDSAGHLLENDHLDLLDYLIAELEKRGIDIVLTAQTNFGNGYPERNIDTGAYSYRADKCELHSDPAIIAAQERYLDALARHVNPYTGRSYAADKRIVAMEINNEPCHGDDSRQVEKYIRRMKQSLRRAGWKKPILYNVSHNPQVREAYYRAGIDGQTYQWYPLGLVSGHTRTGNFLPYVDSYDIPFDTIKGFESPAKVVYEFDPADNLTGYLFPAMARTFRKEGFKWITQFAYDPIDMADSNTEYQTHYLNLAYTPAKAMAMAIAAEVVKRIPEGSDFGKYPTDTVFGPFMVSGRRNMAELNDSDALIYSGDTESRPKDSDALQRIWGVGSSPAVSYNGSGAYFLDRLDGTTWRLEVMPDVVMLDDPFGKPSTTRKVAAADYRQRQFTMDVPGLGSEFAVRRIVSPAEAPATAEESRATGGRFDAAPGVYLLSATPEGTTRYGADDSYGDGHRRVGEYVAARLSDTGTSGRTIHHAAATAPRGIDKIKVEAVLTELAGETPVDSATVYPSTISFWNDENTLYPMTRREGTMEWSAELPVGANDTETQYNIVVWRGGEATTWPGGHSGTPLDWDYTPENDSRYTTLIVDLATEPLTLVEAESDMDGTTLSTLPGTWEGVGYRYKRATPGEGAALVATATADSPVEELTIMKPVGALTRELTLPIADAELLLDINGGEGDGDSVNVSIVTVDGFTYGADVATGSRRIALSEMKLQPTQLNPEPFPTFLRREFEPDPATAKAPTDVNEIDELRITVKHRQGTPSRVGVGGIWLGKKQ